MATTKIDEVLRAVDAASRADLDQLILMPDCHFEGKNRICSSESLYRYAFDCRRGLENLGISVIRDPGLIRLVWRN